ncbi:MAG: HU family DNA-binding protein [Phascolarctobacterium sp.]|nr:HU family DNA-binding protein [Candidatus Phascolarctobacterium caballi]
MNKTELIEEIAKKAKLSKKDATAALTAFIDAVVGAVAKKKKVQLVGFGTFESRKRKARVGKNPRTGATLKIAAATVPAFKAGKAFKDKVNK